MRARNPHATDSRSSPPTSHGTHRTHRGGPRGGPRPAVVPGDGPRTSSSDTKGILPPAIAKGQDTTPPQGSGAPPRSLEPLRFGLGSSVDRAIEGTSEVALLFSGGLDSALLALLLRERARSRGLAVHLTTIGLEGSADLQQSEDAARSLEMAWSGSQVSREEVVEAARKVRATERGVAPNAGTGGPEGVALEVQTGIYLALAHAPCSRVLCGQGADELFLGYAHFRPLSGERLRVRYQEDVRRLREVDWPMSQRLAASLARDLRAPYLDPSWCAQVESYALEARRPSGVPKGLLRQLAALMGLPETLVQRPKKALQYGSGIHSVLSRA
ncbi:MAG: hypothetical protein KGI98_06085 [Euryarchaeota archaeon]|nr:hypothetical protein [Euryarchaeota archaeon]